MGADPDDTVLLDDDAEIVLRLLLDHQIVSLVESLGSFRKLKGEVVVRTVTQVSKGPHLID